MLKRRRKSDNKPGRREMLIKLKRSNKKMLVVRNLLQEMLLEKLKTKVLKQVKIKKLIGNRMKKPTRLNKRMRL